MSPTGMSRIRSRRSAIPREQEAAGGRQGRDVGVGHERSPSSTPNERERPLHDGHRHRREHDADPEARGERHRGEPVEHRLERELVDAPAEPVVERAEDGQRADAEQQGCREPALDEALPGRVVGPSLGAPPPRDDQPWIRPASPSRRSSIRSSEPLIPPMSRDPRTMRSGTPAPTASRSAGSVTETADRPATRRVTRPRASVTTARVWSRSRCPIPSPARPDENCEHVENRSGAGEERGHARQPTGWFTAQLSGLPPGAPGV